MARRGAGISTVSRNNNRLTQECSIWGLDGQRPQRYGECDFDYRTDTDDHSIISKCLGLVDK
jgi:hypothetical protein